MIGERYERQEEIGKGGMGTVYRGMDHISGQPVAIKALKEEVVYAEPHLLTRFQREGDALRQLNHPNIVKMLAMVKEGDAHYLVMEYVGGGSLQDTIDRGITIPVKQVLRIALGAADALWQTHKLDIVHRDIKPANILLTESHTPRLTDFGVAHTSSSNLTQTGTMMGTLSYLSPEVFLSLEVDARSDIWSFGVTLFELLSGMRPFRGETFPQVMMAVLHDLPPDLEKMRPDAPVALVDLIYRMLEKNRDARIPTMQAVGNELEKILQRLPATSRRLRVVAHMVSPVQDTTSRFKLPDENGGIVKLPPVSTPFFGREPQLRELRQQVESRRLVTICGRPGAGKTRLAVEFAQRHADQFSHGVYFVECAGVPDATTLAGMLCHTFEFRLEVADAADPARALFRHLRGRSLLLILDDAQDGEFIEKLTAAVPTLTVLVTAAQALGLRREAVLALGGLDYRPWKKTRTALEYAVTQLFVASAPLQWDLSEDDLPHLYEICRLVNGMPLALELAAAGVRELSVADIADKLAHNVDFLARDFPEISEHERGVRAVFDYLWELLDSPAQDALMKLSIFQDGFTRDAAQEVTGASLQALLTLQHRRLLRREPRGRFALHPVVRRSAGAVLRDASADQRQLEDQHAGHYGDFLHKRKYDLRGMRQESALHHIQDELVNIHQAWQHAATHRLAPELLKMLDSLGKFYVLQHRYAEGLQHYAQTADQLTDPKVAIARGRLLTQYAGCLRGVGRLDDARAMLDGVLPIIREKHQKADLAYALYQMGQVMAAQKAYGPAIHHLQEGLNLTRQTGDQYMLVRMLNALSAVYRAQGDTEYFRYYVRESLEIAQEYHDHFGEMDARELLLVDEE